MRILVCGDRRWKNYQRIYEMLRVLHLATPITLVIEGEARGADKLARIAAEQLGIAVEPHPADWRKYGLRAGPLRNYQMLQSKPDLVLAFHSDLDHSRGTRNMVDQAIKAGIPVQVVRSEIWSKFGPNDRQRLVSN